VHAQIKNIIKGGQRLFPFSEQTSVAVLFLNALNQFDRDDPQNLIYVYAMYLRLSNFKRTSNEQDNQRIATDQ